MLISEVYNRIGTFLVQVINDPLVSIIFANQVSPRPKKPFIIISVGSLRDVSMPMKYEIDLLGVQETIFNKSFLITLESYCDTLHQSEDLLNMVQNYLRTEIAYNHFRADMAYMSTILGVSAMPIAINGINESRAILEMEFNLTQVIQDQVGLIEHIYITDELTGNEYIINK